MVDQPSLAPQWLREKKHGPGVLPHDKEFNSPRKAASSPAPLSTRSLTPGRLPWASSSPAPATPPADFRKSSTDQRPVGAFASRANYSSDKGPQSGRSEAHYSHDAKTDHTSRPAATTWRDPSWASRPSALLAPAPALDPTLGIPDLPSPVSSLPPASGAWAAGATPAAAPAPVSKLASKPGAATVRSAGQAAGAGPRQSRLVPLTSGALQRASSRSLTLQGRPRAAAGSAPLSVWEDTMGPGERPSPKPSTAERGMVVMSLRQGAPRRVGPLPVKPAPAEPAPSSDLSLPEPSLDSDAGLIPTRPLDGERSADVLGAHHQAGQLLRSVPSDSEQQGAQPQALPDDDGEAGQDASCPKTQPSEEDLLSALDLSAFGFIESG
ncbi:hypothetical protein ACKKBF_B16590 [Auxenochlorella protothecoides x Auxenochlorella symbiontica]